MSEPVFDETFTITLKVRGTDTQIGDLDQLIHNAIQNLKDQPDTIVVEAVCDTPRIGGEGTLRKRGWTV